MEKQQITQQSLLALIGKLYIENTILREQLETSQRKIADLETEKQKTGN